MVLDPKQLGRDLVISETGDLVSYGRDFDYVDGPDHVVVRFARELMSPHNLLAAYCRDYQGIKVLEEDYGNHAFYELSEPLDDSWIESVKQSIYLVGEAQPNLTVENVDYYMLDVSKGRMGFDISISVEGGPLKRLYLENNTLGFNVRIADGNRT